MLNSINGAVSREVLEARIARLVDIAEAYRVLWCQAVGCQPYGSEVIQLEVATMPEGNRHEQKLYIG